MIQSDYLVKYTVRQLEKRDKKLAEEFQRTRHDRIESPSVELYRLFQDEDL